MNETWITQNDGFEKKSISFQTVPIPWVSSVFKYHALYTWQTLGSKHEKVT